MILFVPFLYLCFEVQILCHFWRNYGTHRHIQARIDIHRHKMSSNIRIQRVCQYCNKEFTARTTTTRYCSGNCSKKAYKARKRAEKVKKSNTETHKIKTEPIEILKTKEFLSIKEVCSLIGISRRTIYRMFDKNELNKIKIGTRTIIKRSELDRILIPQKTETKNKINGKTKINISDYYNISEILNKYTVSESAVYNMIKRHNIPKIKKGKFVYVPKDIIDKYLN